MYKHILLPTDGSELAALAVRSGIALARSVGARVTGFTVVPEFHVFTYRTELLEDTREEYSRDSQAHAAEYLKTVSDAAAAADVRCETAYVMHDRPYKAIIDAAREKGCDLIVMASHGRGGIAAVVLGSQTQKVLAHSDVPVLVYRHKAG